MVDDDETPGKDPAARVRQLLLSGDNIIKNREDPQRFARARARFTSARETAVGAGLGDSLVELIDRRLEALPGGGGEGA